MDNIHKFKTSSQEGNMNISMNSATENQPKMWPSERIPQGGLFHTPKIQYSKETADLLKCK